MSQLIEQNALAEAAAHSGFLASWLMEPDLATLEEMERVFVTLPRVVEALPPTVADDALMCYLRNRVRSSRELKEAGEFGAAAYQLREMNLKLTRQLRERS